MTDTPERDIIMRDCITRLLETSPWLRSVNTPDDTWCWNRGLGAVRLKPPHRPPGEPRAGYEVTLERASCTIHVIYSDGLPDRYYMDEVETIIGYAIVEKVKLVTSDFNGNIRFECGQLPTRH